MIDQVFCDLDGTLYRNGVTDEDAGAVMDLVAGGVDFHIATGRTFNMALKAIEGKIDFNGYVISQNGAFIHDAAGNELEKNLIEDNIARSIIDKFRLLKPEEIEMSIYYKVDGKTYMEEWSPSYDKVFGSHYRLDKDFGASEKYLGKLGNIGVASSDYESLAKLEQALKKDFSEYVDIYFSSENTINIVDKRASKFNAIKEICAMNNKSVDNAAGIGDSPNDESMVSGCGYGFAMNTAADSVKAGAQYEISTIKEACDIINFINRD